MPIQKSLQCPLDRPTTILSSCLNLSRWSANSDLVSLKIVVPVCSGDFYHHFLNILGIHSLMDFVSAYVVILKIALL